MKVIGLTGSIGCGKSTASKYLKEQGYEIFDADSCVHDLLLNNREIITNIISEFKEVDDGKGKVDRVKLSDIIFSDMEKVKLLESILHPEVKRRVIERIRISNLRQIKGLILDVVLLFESKMEYLCDKVILITTCKNEQRRRVLARSNMTEDKLSFILARQMGDEQKRLLADFVIDNNTSIEDLHYSLDEVISKINS